jgi:Flp pilus assembly protein TadG
MPRVVSCQRGQAAVETVALLPLLALLALAAWQAALAGQAAWLAGAAAHAAARAAAVGGDPERAARGALPPSLERGLRVEAATDDGAGVVVRVQLRSVLADRRLATLAARAGFPEQRG